MGGGSEAKLFKGKYEAKLQFQREGGGWGLNQKLFHNRVWIFPGKHILYKSNQNILE